MVLGDRRGFLRKVAGLATCPAAAPASRVRPPASYPTNGDEASLPHFIANFTKGLPHAQLGEMVPSRYRNLASALDTGTVAAKVSILQSKVDTHEAAGFQFTLMDCTPVTIPGRA